MNDMVIYSGIMLASVLISSVSQILLKKSAQKQYPSKIREYLNPMVIIAYGIFFGSSLISMYALKVVPLSMAPILESAGYIFVSLLSFIFIKEKMSRRQLVGMMLIITGIVIYSV